MIEYQSVVQRKLGEEIQLLLKTLVNEYRSGSLSAERAREGIAQIAVLQMFAIKVGRSQESTEER